MMNDYIIFKQTIINTAIQLYLLPIAENLKYINKTIIPPTQQKEISRYKFQHDSDKRLLARSFCYEFVQEHYGVPNFELGFNEYQKPLLKAALHINFSFSYAKDYVLVGISTAKRIGIDIEYINPTFTIHEVAPEIMCAAELEEFLSYKDKSLDQRIYFFKLFSAKESIIKAFGTGLYFNVKKLNTLHTHTYFYEGVKFTHQPLDVWMNEYTLSVCYEQKI